MPFLPIQRGDCPDAAPGAAADPPNSDDIAKQLNFVENIANWLCPLSLLILYNFLPS
jgi:hypothetical protein